ALQIGSAGDPKMQAVAAQGTAAAIDRLNQALAAYRQQPLDDDEQQVLGDFTNLWTQFTDAMAAIRAGKAPGIDFNVVVPGMEAAIDKLSRLEAHEVDENVAAAHAHYAAARLQVLIALMVGLVAAAGLALLISASMTRRLRPVVDAMDAVAAGDLSRTVAVSGRDTVAALARSAERVSHSAGQLDTVTAGVAGSVRSVAERSHAADRTASQVSGNVQTVAAA